MDESELLIARAALAEPGEAVAAWTEWRATNSIEEASALLSWAGGYIHRNLQAAGVDDAYLSGIYRYNWVMNNHRVVGALPTIRHIAERWPITPLKSFGMSEDVYSRGLRPLADFDFYAEASHVYDIKHELESRGYSALEGVSGREFATRIVPQRGSWNFLNPQRVDIDLHWRLLGHLDLAKSERLVSLNSRLIQTEFGAVRVLSADLMLITLAVHHLLQPSGQLNGIFDFYHLVPRTNPAGVARLARSIGVSREVAEVAGTARTLAGVGATRSLGDLERALAAAARRQPPSTTVRRVSPVFERIPRRYRDTTRLRAPRLYRLWFALGRPAWLERFLIRRLGSLSRVEPAEEQDTFPAVQGSLGLGWHYRYPGDPFRWAGLPDTRTIFSEPPSGARALCITLDLQTWRKTSNSSFDVFASGRRLGRCDQTSGHFEFAIPTNPGSVEVSLRQHGLSRYVRPGMHSEWFRMLAPVVSIEIVPRAPETRHLE